MSGLRQLFDDAVALGPDERERFLHEHCPDPDLRSRVQRLLDANDTQDDLDRLRLPALSRGIGEPTLAPTLAAGQRIGPFELLGMLGEGGSATVWRARRVVDGVEQQVAVKVLHRNLLSSASRRQFDRERRALAQLRHPQIARFIEGGVTEGGVAWLAIELIDGKPFTEHASTAKLSLRARLRLFLAACRAVQSAHSALIVHRDLKPSNMLVTAEGHVKLLDFGIAKWLADIGDETRSQHRAFTPAYAAPEQRDGGAITTATDVYALGVILGELVSGRRVNETDGVTPSILVSRDPAPAGLPVPPKQLRRLLRGDIDNIVMKAVSADPARRYDSAGSLADDVERLLDGRPVHAHPPSRSYVLGKFVNRHRGSVAVTVVLLLATFFGLAMSVWQGMIARHEAAIARAEAARADSMRDFMFDAFGEAEPGAPKKGPMTVLEATDRAWRAAHDDAGADPRARIELLLRLAQVSLRQGNLDLAAARAAEVLDIAVAALGERDPLALEARFLVARVDDTAGRYERARAGVDAVLAAAPEGPNDLRIAALRKSGAMAARPERDAERSKRDGERAIALARELGDPDELIAALNGRGSALVDLGDVEGPVPLFEEALALSRARYGEKHENVALALAALSRTYRRAGEFARAEAAARSAVEMDREIYDGDHWVTGNHLNALAIALDVQGRIDEALPEAIESLRVAVATQGADHRETQIQRSFTAALLSRSGREAEARDLWLAALAGMVRASGPYDPDAALMRMTYGSSLAELGDPRAGDDEIQGALVMARGASPAAPADVIGRILERRVIIASRWGTPAETLARVDELAAGTGALTKGGWAGRVETWRAHAQWLAGRSQEAVALAEASRKAIDDRDYPGRLLLAQNRLVCALAARAAGQGALADAAAKEADALIAGMEHPPARLLELVAARKHS